MQSLKCQMIDYNYYEVKKLFSYQERIYASSFFPFRSIQREGSKPRLTYNIYPNVNLKSYIYFNGVLI